MCHTSKRIFPTTSSASDVHALNHFLFGFPHLVELSFDSKAGGYLAVLVDALVQELRSGRHERHPLSPRVVGDYGVGETLLPCLESDERLPRDKRETLD